MRPCERPCGRCEGCTGEDCGSCPDRPVTDPGEPFRADSIPEAPAAIAKTNDVEWGAN